jgi:hypothetical protein
MLAHAVFMYRALHSMWVNESAFTVAQAHLGLAGIKFVEAVSGTRTSIVLWRREHTELLGTRLAAR